ncbi:hypothetical protein [Jiangella gansuensis]|uniref:hypothetical protein n=1 Tax=Jiangella gansuensis TaxID=281473 RepID=UPI00047C5316|nr:hypothetical protein [Jiangella gansuensis]
MTEDRAAERNWPAGHGRYEAQLSLELDLDVVGLAAAYGDYAGERGIAAGRQREAIIGWLDELIADLEQDAFP